MPAAPLSEDYLQRFSGVERLYGTAGLQRLRRAHVAVVGVGGVGSWTVEALARSGLGTITMIDLDDVCITNVNRQLPALNGHIGRPKTTAVAERIRLINPSCEIREITEFFAQSNADRLLSPGYDCVIDAIDRISLKALLLAECHARKIPAITVGGAGGKRDGTAIRVADLAATVQDDLLKFVRKKLRADHGFPEGVRGEAQPFGIRAVFSTEKPHYPWPDGSARPQKPPACELKLDCQSGYGTAAHVTAAFGLAAAGEAIRLLAL